MKKVSCRNEREANGVNWTAKVMDFGVSLTVIEALNDGLNAFLSIRDNKSVYRQKVKQLANEAERKMTLQKAAILSNMKDRRFFDSYSDAVIDFANKDVQAFRDSLKKTLDENNIKHSDMLSNAETARVMLTFAVVHYESVIDAARHKFLANYKNVFNDYDLTDVRKTWERLCKILYEHQTADFNTKESKALYEQLSNKFTDGVYVKQCLQEAKKECPYMKDVFD